MDTQATGLIGLVTTTEAGRLLGVTPNAVLQRIRRYNLHTVAIGKSLLVSLADLMATYQEPPRLLEALEATV